MAFEKDYFKSAIQTLCKVQHIPPRKTRFTKHDNLITISIKNESENGIDMNCFQVTNIIYSLIGPAKTKFTQVPIMFPNSQKVDRITIIFEENDYKSLVHRLFNENS